MKRIYKRGIALLMMLAMVIAMGGKAVESKAAESTYLVSAPGTATNVNVQAGEKKTVELSLISYNRRLDLNGFSIVETSKKGFFEFSNIRLFDNFGKELTNNNDVAVINSGTIVKLSFDVSVSESASIGAYPLELKAFGIVYPNSSNPYYDPDQMPYSITDETVANFGFTVTSEKKPAELVVSEAIYNVSAPYPGNSFNLTLKIKNEGEIAAHNVYAEPDLSGTGLIPGYTVERNKIGTIEPGKTKTLELTLKVPEGTPAGSKAVSLKLSYKNTEDIKDEFIRVFYINVKEEKKQEEAAKKHANLEIIDSENIVKIKAGEDGNISFKVKNSGETAAKNIAAKVDNLGSGIGVIKDYFDETYALGTLKEGKTAVYSIPVKALADAATNLTEISITLFYTEEDSKEPVSKTITMYLDVDGIAKPVETPNMGALVISGISQSPAAPSAGGSVSLFFTITNEANFNARDVRISGSGYSASGFEPADSEPSHKVGSIDAGEKKSFSYRLNVGEMIPDGVNSANITLSYADEKGNAYTENYTLYVFNCVSKAAEEKDDKNSRPKLIISDYSTDTEELKAGSTFNFSISFTNTHSTKAAKNIMVTISQLENVFSATQGSSSIFIKNISADETFTAELPMKVKTNVATGTYDLNINVKYDYDDMAEVDKDKGGAEENYTVKLSAIENLRPAIENIYSENWEGVYLNQDLQMYFEFYNMGMSSLNNVYVTVDGDFCLANNSEMKYVGSLSSYSSEYVDMTVVPLTAGYAEGTLTVHFEDSTGTEYTTSTTFYENVQEQQNNGAFEGEFGGGFEDNFGGFEDNFGGEETQDEILPLWLFIVICTAVFFIGFGITFGVIIRVKRKKLTRRLEEEE